MKIFKRFLSKERREIKKNSDDYDWKTYHAIYRNQLEQISTEHTLILHKNDFMFQDGHLLNNQKTILPLHPNHKLLYETILQLVPHSVLELGCGGGDHLHNINLFAPEIRLFGLEVSSSQLDFLKERHPNLNADIKKFDCTLPFPQTIEKVDIAFTQAVIMHIHTGNGHLVALSNLFRIAKNQVILMENWKQHSFMDDINKLFKLKIISWLEIYFHYREIEESQKPHLMVISSTPLKQYPVLNDYKILRDNM